LVRAEVGFDSLVRASPIEQLDKEAEIFGQLAATYHRCALTAPEVFQPARQHFGDGSLLML
jgi:hypothetical protein